MKFRCIKKALNFLHSLSLKAETDKCFILNDFLSEWVLVPLSSDDKWSVLFFLYFTARLFVSSLLLSLYFCAITSLEKFLGDREQINGGILPSVQLQLRLDLAGVREENGQSEAVHQADTELLAVNTNIADNVETSPKHSLPLHTKTLLIRLVCQHLGWT